MQHDPGGDVLSSLLAMLSRARTLGSPIASVVNETTVNLTCKLLLSRDPKDYVNIMEHLSDDSDVEILLDFMLHLLCERRLSDPAAAAMENINLRARRLMLKVATRALVVPRSLMVAGVKIRSERDLIGSGGFGHVFKGELQGLPVALKVLYKTNRNVDFRREALMWRSLNHNLVLPFLGIYENDSASFLVSPYMKNGTLVQWRKNANPSIAEIQKRVWPFLLPLVADIDSPGKILEVAEGMEYIHSEGVVHGDLRGDNILLDADFHVKIADFGLTRVLEATVTRSGALHLNFAAPELFGCFQDDASDDVPARTQKSDVYAFGCLYYEIHYDIVPFAGKQELQILGLIYRGVVPPRLYEPPMSNEAWNLIQCCWSHEVSERPAMKDVVESMMVTSNATRNLILNSLLSILRDKKPGLPITSVVNTTSIDLLHNLLTCQDYVDAAEKLNYPSDIMNILEFILFVLRNRHFSNPDPHVDTNRRARRLMSKIISKSRVMPRSLSLTGLTMPGDHDFIGGGTFGLVYKGEHQGRAVGLKVLYKTRYNVDFCREALMWRSLHYKFLLPFLGIYESEASPKFFLVSPYMANGTLAQWRKRVVPSLLNIEIRLLEVALGVHYIHSEGVVHGDLRGANVILDDEFHAKIADFGLSRHSEAAVMGYGALHHNFAAPELFGYTDDDRDDRANSTARTQESDVYAFGCLYYEIHYGAIPFEDLGALPIMKAVTRGERPPRLDNPPLDDDVGKLMHQCWAHDKRLRPSIRDVVTTIKSWKKSPILSMSPAPSISQSSDSVPRVSAPGREVVVPPSNIFDSTRGYNNGSSDDIPETSPALKDSEDKDKEINQLQASLERLRREAGKKSTGFFSNAQDFTGRSAALRQDTATSTGDERIVFSVEGRAAKNEGAISKNDGVLKAQEMWKNSGGAKAQKIMDELNDSSMQAKKMAEMQKQKIKQRGSDIEYHLEEQRAHQVQLENQVAEIDRLQKQSKEKDKLINQLQASLERLRQEAWKKSTRSSSNVPYFAGCSAARRHGIATSTDDKCILSSVKGRTGESELTQYAGIMDKSNETRLNSVDMQKAKKKQWGNVIEYHLEEEHGLQGQLENQIAEIDCLQKQSEEKDKEINQLRASLERLRQEAGKKSTEFFSNARGFSHKNPVMTDVHWGDVQYHTNRENRVLLDELLIAADGMYDSLSRFNPSFCHPGTRENILKAITDWVDKPDPEKRILWVNGVNGTGKSTIAQTIINRYKDRRIAATFFFLKGHADCGNANRLFTTLARQMAESIPETSRHIESVLNAQRLIHTKDLEAQFHHLFVEVFRRVPELRPEKSLVVIDGIDELSPERQQTDLLTLIGDRLEIPVIPLRFIIFSRPETHIERIFLKENMSKITHTLALDNCAPKEDIRRYLTDKFLYIFTRRDARLPLVRDINSVVSKSSGQFLFASTVASFIDDDGFDPQEQLGFVKQLRVTEDSPFALTDQLYMHILSQQEDIKMLRDFFVLLIALGHPKISFVSQRLGIKEKELRLKLRAIRALVRITDPYVSACHRTLHDFFLDRERSKQYYIHPMRVSLVQLPQKGRMFRKSLGV